MIVMDNKELVLLCSSIIIAIALITGAILYSTDFNNDNNSNDNIVNNTTNVTNKTDENVTETVEEKQVTTEDNAPDTLYGYDPYEEGQPELDVPDVKYAYGHKYTLLPDGSYHKDLEPGNY